MTPAIREKTLAEALAAENTLTVVRSSSAGRELFLSIDAADAIVAYCGHVDLGTGIRTALAQIVAEELDVPVSSVSMVLGTTSVAPDQGPTIASETIQITAEPLRRAAATARRWLLDRAAARFAVGVEALVFGDGAVRHGNVALSFAELVRDGRHRLEIDLEAPIKAVADYRLVGTSAPRADIAAKTQGAWTYVHDVRVPGMLHGRVIRPPHVGWDHGSDVGASLRAVDENSVADIAGLVGVVVVGDFVGVVAEREEQAVAAAERLRVTWAEPAARPDLSDLEAAIRANPAKTRVLADRGDVDRALAAATPAMARTYVWPYQMHGSIGPSCAVADVRDDGVTVWSGTQNPHWMRRDLARLLDRPEHAIVVERLEAAGCYGRNCADDVTADAALLSRAVNRPVRVQLTREQEHGWEPKGAGQVIDVRGGLDREGGPIAYDFETRYPSNLAPTLALVLTGKVPPVPDVVEMGDRTAIPPYAIGNMRVAVHDMPPLARASWFRGVSAMPNSFAHESFMDELAAAAGVDPIEYRLRYLTDPRAIDLVHAVRERSRWTARTRWGTAGGEGDLLYGRGFAYALYVHGKFPGTPAAWSAWVADVAVNRRTGELVVTKVTVGQDSGLMINPDGVKHQIHGNVIQSISRVLKEKVGFTSAGAVESREWGGYPILTFEEVPEIDVLMIPRPDEEPRGVGESASVPSAAAIVNAVYDATGLRFRELPLTPDRILAGLRARGLAAEDPTRLAGPSPVRARRRWFALGAAAGLAGAALTGLALASPFRGAIAEIARPDPASFSAASVERGRLAAAVGTCAVCHIGADGRPYAGGRAFETPFGTIYAANITPDVGAGIGAWSYPAFARAMREGVSRDGHHLYPAHPYTSFVNAADRDLQDLYAYLMTGAPVAATPPPASMRPPFGFRPMMAAWNALFLRPTPVTADPARGEAWNRGAELVEGLGHCSACHSPRNALGAEARGPARYSGGEADGWIAPALGAASRGPVGWTEDALFDYLRTGVAAGHGAAGGPMAAVVKSLAALPDAEIRAMAVYLADLGGPRVDQAAALAAAEAAVTAAEAARAPAAIAEPEGARLFEGACSSCHEGGQLASLALSTALHLDRPVNAIAATLQGVEAPAAFAHRAGRPEEVMAMPSFAASFSDRQMAALLGYLRARFAPSAPAWSDLPAAVAKARPG